MKKIHSLILLVLLLILKANAQSVAINTDKSAANASAILDVKSSNKGLLIPRTSTTSRNAIVNPAKGLMVYDTTAGSFWFYNGSGWNALSTGSSTNYWTTSQNGFDIYNNTGGNVGMGTATPYYKVTVQTQSDQFGVAHTDGNVILASYIGTFQGALGGWLGTRTNHPLYFYTNNSAQQMAVLPNGNIGIGTINPTNKLQINGPATGFIDYDFAIARNAQAMAIYQGPNFTNLASTANITINPKNGTGYVGINVGGNPGNRLQIGSMGPAGFNGNDLAIGNGTNAMVITQTNTSTLIASTNDIVLKPRNNDAGNVGINTSTPHYPLEVYNYGITPATSYAYYALKFDNFYEAPNTGGNNGAVNVSIYASARVMASEFNAFSDARIKNISGVSNSSKDLQTINALTVTDYTMKDRARYGNQSFKKVIAQEVEKVYPQVVSKHTDFIPNVYQLTKLVEPVESGYLLTFAAKHNISDKAKKIQVLEEGKGMQEYAVVDIPSATKVIISATAIEHNQLFVYGEEVSDFRTVDYEGLTTLNISATQELNKLLIAQNKKIAALAEEVLLLKQRIASAPVIKQ